METIARQDFTTSFFRLLTETFEGPPEDTGSAYLDKKAGLFQTLEQVTAEVASTPVRPGSQTIAAHCEHVRFYVVVAFDFMRGNTERIDWSKSWLVHTVTAEEWEELKKGLKSAYTTVLDYLQSTEKWGDEEVGDGMAIIVHTAYHLGSIRQLVRLLAD
jgi:hypothetical protein